MKLRFLAIVIFISVCAAPPAFCEEGADWLTIESNYFTIEYQQSVKLKTVISRLNRRGLFSGGFFSSRTASAATQEEEVAQRMDRLLKMAEGILEMYPPKLKITIKIFADSSALNEAYFRMFGGRTNYEAFHVFQSQTIYTSQETISDTVIIHEMAHAVVDNYFSTTPPPRVSEIIAQYVDVHLED